MIARPRYTYVVKGRFWYYRRCGEPLPLPGQPGAADFEAAYHGAHARVSAMSQARASAQQSKASKLSDRAMLARRRNLERADQGRSGHVYFIAGARTKLIKIGFTSNVAARLARLQMNSPGRLRVLATFAGSRRDELALHQQFEADRAHGEWFRATPELLAIIAQIATGGTLASAA